MQLETRTQTAVSAVNEKYKTKNTHYKLELNIDSDTINQGIQFGIKEKLKDVKSGDKVRVIIETDDGFISSPYMNQSDLDNFFSSQTVDDFEDERPVYENKSPGYLKIRNLNQSILIRNEESQYVGLNNIVYNDLCPTGGFSYLCEGFTITMWVKFRDKVNSGTLFNLGNVLRYENPRGLMLETFVINKNDTQLSICEDCLTVEEVL